MTRNLIKLSLAILLGLYLAKSCLSMRSHEEIVQEAATHVVPWKLLSHGNDNFATGFHVKWQDSTYILTNKHVCDASVREYKHRFIQFGDYIGEIIYISQIHDLCLVTSNRSDGLEIAEDAPVVLQPITVIGYPRGLDKTIREGRVVSFDDIYAPWVRFVPISAMKVSAIGYGGNSGSPILNESGEVVAVLYAGSRVYHTEMECVPHPDLIRFMEYVLGKR